MNRLEGKTVLITGASAGIGEACARAFAERGAHLVLLARRTSRLEVLKEQLEEAHGVSVRAANADVTDYEALRELHDDLRTRGSSVDILVNNAALASGGDKVYEGGVTDWDRMLDTNVKAVLGMIQLFVPGMIERNSGHVVNVGSIAGHQVYPSNAVYIATKHAVLALTRSLAIDLVGTDVRVTAISPGLVETEFSEARFGGDSERARKVYEGYTPLTPADVADTILYATNLPSHVNVADLVLLPTDQRNAWLLHRDES